MSDKLTKHEVCQLLGIKYSTLGRWMREGKIAFERDPDWKAKRGECTVHFDRDEVQRLLTPVSTAKFAAHPPAQGLPPGSKPPTAHPEIPLPYQDEPKPDTRDFAQRYRDGDETDSLGNEIGGYNENFPTTGSTLLGPIVPYTPPPVNRDTASHMSPALVGKVGPSANNRYLDSLERQRDTGAISQACYDSLTETASKANRMSTQQRKVYVDRAAIMDAFRHGFSR